MVWFAVVPVPAVDKATITWPLENIDVGQAPVIDDRRRRHFTRGLQTIYADSLLASAGPVVYWKPFAGAPIWRRRRGSEQKA